MENKSLLFTILLVASHLNNQAAAYPDGVSKLGVLEQGLDNFILAQIPGFQASINGSSMFMGTFGFNHVNDSGHVMGNVTNVNLKGHSIFDFKSTSDLSTMDLLFTFNFQNTVLSAEGNYAMEGEAQGWDETEHIPVKGEGALTQTAISEKTSNWLIRAVLEVDSEGYASINPNITRDGESYGVISTFEGIENFDEIELSIISFLNLVGYTIFSPIFQTLQLRLGLQLIEYLNVILKTVTLEDILARVPAST